jgi:hypothetical protein
MYGKDKNGVGRAIVTDNIGIINTRSAMADAALRGRLFSVANQAAVATTAALNTTWTGLGLSNPASSGKNAIIWEFGWSVTASPAAAAGIGLMTSDTTGFADSLTAKAAKAGAGNAVVYADAGATIATPILERVYGQIGTEATTAGWALPNNVININGSIILPPGRSVMTYSSAAVAAVLIFHFVWEEVDV